MPRKKLSEYRAKHIAASALDIPYQGWEMSGKIDLKQIEAAPSYVVKVDQAVKGRFKKGLVLLEVKKTKLKESLQTLERKGYDHFLVEPYKAHKNGDERYLSIMHDREGCVLAYSKHGGIDIESNQRTIKRISLDSSTDWTRLAKETGISEAGLQNLWNVFKSEHMVFLEINPYIVRGDGVDVLDCAIEIDNAGTFYATEWTGDDLRTPRAELSEQEKAIQVLDENSPASFNLNVLNKDGGIFLLLSGGGASVVIADEIYNRGYGEQLANYGEYSGNPTMHETYLYTKEVFELMFASAAPKKVVFIGGAVANFTDIANTFNGVIKAIDECADRLKEQGVKIFVRRGGPRQEIGLAKMEAALDTYGLLGGVYDPKTSITDALSKALMEMDV